MNGPGQGAGVLRGMGIEPLPARLGRPRAEASCAPAPSASAERQHALAREREQARKDGFEEGLAAGHAEGLRQALSEAPARVKAAVDLAIAEATAPLLEQRERLNGLEDELQHALQGRLQDAEEELVALCFEALCRIVGEQGAEPQVVRAQLRTLLASCGSDDVVVRVHPNDAQWLSAHAPDAASRWHADAEVALGGCIVETPSGGLDARLDAMLEACRQALLATRDRQRREQAA